MLYLTSNIGASNKINGVRVATALNNENGLVDSLKKNIKAYDNFVFVASDPNSYENTDMYAKCTFEAFKLSGLEFKNLIVLDNRTKAKVDNIMLSADLVFLAGGSTLTQNIFFRSMSLKRKLKNFDGVIIGQSAGSMNMATRVYDFPESKEELDNPKYLDGLGLTDINIIPHIIPADNSFKTNYDIEVIHDYFLKDSLYCPLYAIPDGTHIEVDGTNAKVYGICYKVFDNKCAKISNDKEVVNLK